MIQAKVRCVDGVLDTGWFVPGKETTIIYGPTGSGKSHFLQALQWLNPLYDIQQEQPFLHHPKIWHQGVHTRKVLPAKKTALFMVFSAEPLHVLELEKIEPVLIETDRIEVGRRLDYSRWMTFVEISASSRWSEIAEEMTMLYDSLSGEATLPESALQVGFLYNRKATDRLKAGLADDCQRWLEAIEPLVAVDKQDVFQHCLRVVGRNRRFKQAQKQVTAWLPLTIYLHSRYLQKASYTFSEICTDSVNNSSDPIKALLRTLCKKFMLTDDIAGEKWLKLEEQVASLSQLLREQGVAVPTLGRTRDGLCLEGYESQQTLDRRFLLISVTCLLAELSYGSRPLLLLDGFDEDLTSAEITRMVYFVQKLSQRYQVITATGNDKVLGAGGWQAVFQTANGGLADAQLIGS